MSREELKDLYGLIGFPASHSLSPSIFTAAFEAAGIEAAYERFPAPPDRLGREMLLLQAARAFFIWLGCEAPIESMRTAMNRALAPTNG